MPFLTSGSLTHTPPPALPALSPFCPRPVNCAFLTTLGILEDSKLLSPTGSDILTTASSRYPPNSSDSTAVCLNIGLFRPNRAETLAMTSHAWCTVGVEQTFDWEKRMEE